MSRPQRHYLDELGDDLFEWIESMVDSMVAAFEVGGKAPFAAPTTEKQKLAYYRSVLFNPDGSPNQQGRADTLARVGVEGFAQIMAAVAKDGRPGLPEQPTPLERTETGVA